MLSQTKSFIISIQAAKKRKTVILKLKCKSIRWTRGITLARLTTIMLVKMGGINLLNLILARILITHSSKHSHLKGKMWIIPLILDSMIKIIKQIGVHLALKIVFTFQAISLNKGSTLSLSYLSYSNKLERNLKAHTSSYTKRHKTQMQEDRQAQILTTWVGYQAAVECRVTPK